MNLTFYIISFGLAIVVLLAVGLIASFSPLLYVTQYRLLAKANGSYRSSLSLIMGILAGITFLVVLLVLFQSEVVYIAAATNYLEPEVLAWFDLGVGLALVIISIGLIWRLQKTDGQKVINNSASNNAQSTSIFVFGFVRSITRLTALAALLFGIHYINATTFWWTLKSILVAVLIFGTMIPYLVMWVAKLFRPNYYRRMSEIFKKITSEKLKIITAILLGILGILFIAKAITVL